MRVNIRPKSLLGKWSVGLATAFILLFVLSLVLARLGGGVGPGPFGVVMGVALAFSGITALLTGIISMIINKERAILVLLAIIIGILCLIFFLGGYPQKLTIFVK